MSTLETAMVHSRYRFKEGKLIGANLSKHKRACS